MLHLALFATAAANDICVGSVSVKGSGSMQVIRNTGAASSAYQKAAPVKVENGEIKLTLEPHTDKSKASRNGARAYLGTSCTEGAYNHSAYGAWPLLGKTMSFTVDLSAAGCGCNAAMYLVSMNQNTQPGTCDSDYYCDANNVCGVRCAEIDVMEANKHALHTTAHTPNDGGGAGSGLGGGMKSFSKSDYGPGGAKVDTTRPFTVSTYFGVSNGALSSIEVTLQGESGGTVHFTAGSSSYLGGLSSAALAGMTPVVSYWSASDMRWLDSAYYPDPYDGGSTDPCPWDAAGVSGYPSSDNQDTCGESISFSNFAITDGRALPADGVAVPKPPRSFSKRASLEQAWMARATSVEDAEY